MFVGKGTARLLSDTRKVVHQDKGADSASPANQTKRQKTRRAVKFSLHQDCNFLQDIAVNDPPVGAVGNSGLGKVEVVVS